MAFESWIEEMAREELEKLKQLHPNRFNSLKTELQLFISEPKLEPVSLSPEPISVQPTFSAATQVSSNRKRSLDCGKVQKKEVKNKKVRKEVACMHGRMKDKVEIAIERAEACLERIREVKNSLIPQWLVNQTET